MAGLDDAALEDDGEGFNILGGVMELLIAGVGGDEGEAGAVEADAFDGADLTVDTDDGDVIGADLDIREADDEITMMDLRFHGIALDREDVGVGVHGFEAGIHNEFALAVLLRVVVITGADGSEDGDQGGLVFEVRERLADNDLGLEIGRIGDRAAKGFGGRLTDPEDLICSDVEVFSEFFQDINAWFSRTCFI